MAIFRLSLSSWVISFLSFTTLNAHAVGIFDQIKEPQQSSEYIYRSSPKESLISVQLLGAVNRPGLYYLPINTDLLKLLTLAGGTTNGGDLSEILLRTKQPRSWSSSLAKPLNDNPSAIQVDGEKLIRHGEAGGFRLQQDDFVFVPPKTAWISSETSRNITIGSVVLGMILTSVLIGKNTDAAR
jgi:competence protein ComEA